jgi:hypothetical protein
MKLDIFRNNYFAASRLHEQISPSTEIDHTTEIDAGREKEDEIESHSVRTEHTERDNSISILIDKNLTLFFAPQATADVCG